MVLGLGLGLVVWPGYARAQSNAPVIAHAWAGVGYEIATGAGPHGPLRQGVVVEGSARIPFIPVEFGLRTGWAWLDERTTTTSGFVLGLRVGVDFTELLYGAGFDASGPVSVFNPALGIGADFAYATGTRGEVGRGFLYVANTAYVTCNVGVRISADISLTDWSVVPPTFYFAVVAGQRWVYEDAMVNCNGWERYRARMRRR